MIKTDTWTVKQVEQAPHYEALDPGVLYHSEVLGFIQHLCACGCGISVHVSTTGAGENWELVDGAGGPTVIGSFSDRFHCRSHYSIKDGKTVWYGSDRPVNQE